MYVYYYIYSPWRHACKLLHLLTMETCIYTTTSTHHGDMHVYYYIYSPWRHACILLHLLTMETCMECLSASLYTATVWMPIFLHDTTSTHHGDMHGVFVSITVHSYSLDTHLPTWYYIYSPWRHAWSVCLHHCTQLQSGYPSSYMILHLLTMETCMYTTSTHHGDMHGVFVCITVHSYSLDAHLPSGTHYTTGDLPSIRDQDFLYWLDCCE